MPEEADSTSTTNSTSTDIANGTLVLTPEIIRLAVLRAHADEQYTYHDGGINNQARIEAGFKIINRAVVDEPNERATKAIAKSDLVSQVFPHLPGPEEWDDHDNPDLAEAVYNAIATKVWTDAKPDRTGKIQQLVGQTNGLPEMVLCRTSVGKHQIPAVYITRNLKCLLVDNSAQMKRELQKKSENYARNLAMWMERVPEHAEALDKDYKAGMKKAVGAGQAIMQLALEETVEIRGAGDDGAQ